VLDDILWRNKGQVLTPELILGIIQGASYVAPQRIPIDNILPSEHEGYVFAVERFEDILEELAPMHALHYSETETFWAGIEFNPDYRDYIECERAGGSLQFTIRKDGVLVGQCLMKVFKSRHTQTLAASEDALFIHPDHRRGLAFFRYFIRWIEDALACLGVRQVTLTSKTANSADKLMMRCGYKPTATQLGKILEV